ncbi:hypothetical protein IC620_08680 [Hazenella sp. IB182357]|uniref:Flp pilus assembly protein CpaB n=1 Tax=Polycladospora coralii TaxID=2771432 RepID=A0A926NAE8_9BACL|nr:hypothetical protein [Polycladospora coralii]MBD1372432.1 hypothetical protein [Polycladospora coralii]MBS7531754.1 hypothetical protein [Polycladospora coralii]
MQDAKRRAMLFLILALILSTVAAYLFMEKVNSASTELSDTITLYKATKKIDARQPLKREDFEAVEVPVKFIEETNLMGITSLDAIQLEQNSEGIPLEALVSVTPLIEGDVLTSNTLKVNNIVSSADKRMVVLPRSNRVGFDGSFDYNDRVDIVVTSKESNTKTMFRSIPIIGISKSEEGGLSGLGLEMTLSDAEKLIQHQNFSVSIRVLKAPNSDSKNNKQTGAVNQKIDKKDLPKQEEKEDEEKEVTSLDPSETDGSGH